MPAAPSRRVPAPPPAMVYIAYSVTGGRAAVLDQARQTEDGLGRLLTLCTQVTPAGSCPIPAFTTTQEPLTRNRP